MKGKTAHCDWKSAPQKEPCPCDRYKHACVICRGFVYLHGGWNTTSLRDFWRYNIVKDEWKMLDYSRDGPEELEEYSVVAYKGNLYIFHGMMDSAFTQAKTPLWTYDTGVIHNHQIPQDGQSALTYQQRRSPSHDTGPGPLHGHSTVVYRTGMELFGGPMGLSKQKDLWKWDFVSSSWSNIRTSQGSPPVVGHASIVCKDSMLIFGGGISNSSPNDHLWKYHFHIQTWKKLSSTANTNCPPKMYHHILGIVVDFQTASDFTDLFLSHWKNGQKDHCQLVPIPRHTHFRNYFHQQPMDCALSSEESNAIETKTFSLPLHFRPPQRQS